MLRRFLQGWAARLKTLALWVLTAHGVFLAAGAVTLLLWRDLNPGATVFMAWRRINGQEVRPLEWLTPDQIPGYMERAFILLEDHNFRTHWGFDLGGIRDAWDLNQRLGRLYAGGSTITQQLARNLLLTPHRTWLRKYLEAWVTLGLEAFWPKERILEVYMNVIEFGPGVFGLGAASRYHFKRPFAQTTRDQRYRLAAVISGPLLVTPQSLERHRGMLARYQALWNRL